MSVRAMWKGVLQLNSHEVPVKLYAAAQDRTVHFHLLHRKDKQPVKQRMANAKTGKEVSPDQRRKGAEISGDRIVMLDQNDLETLVPKSSREIRITQIVPRSELPHPWYNRPYYLGPDGDEDAYHSLAEALHGDGQEGVAQWVMRNKTYVGSLVVREGHLMLITLRHTREVVEPDEIHKPEGADLDPKEVDMARQLLTMYESDFDPGAYRDEYRGRVMDMIETKARGGKVVKRKPSRKKQDSLSSALAASLKNKNR